jgi:8-oxo-dGTP pyrophosphatase MutT (NUDIX family)
VLPGAAPLGPGLPRYTRGRVVFAGDAAHAVLATAGSGRRRSGRWRAPDSGAGRPGLAGSPAVRHVGGQAAAGAVRQETTMTESGPPGFRDRIAAHLAGFPRAALPAGDLKPASVALCVVIRDGEPCLLITRRAARLRSHSGQWALPGGRRDPGESIQDAARRELAEETGLQAGPGGLLGVLDDYATRSGYLMTPVVIWGGEAAGRLRPNAAEVARLYTIPVADLDVPPRLLAIPESDRPVLQLPLLNGMVNAPTAAIIYQFCQVALHGLATRVAHYEQPVFAWK